MMDLDEIERNLMREVSGLAETPAGAYNFRVNGKRHWYFYCAKY